MNKRPSRPPGQYVVAAGTQFCLVQNEYDKNTYAQCTYISHRTRIRCKQIRPKEELSRNNGICEEHDQLRDFLKQNHNKELLRIRSECENLQSKRKKFKMLIVANECVSDEDEWLQPATTMGDEIPDQLYDNPLDDEPLRNAEVFTEKDTLKMKMGLVRKDIEDFQLHRDYLEAHASRLCEKIGDSGKTVTVDIAHLRTYDASNHYGSKDYLKYTENEPVSSKCLFGRNPSDAVIVLDVVESMLDKLEGVERQPFLHVCNQPALDYSDYCLDHILMEEKQQLFANCTICGDIALATNDPTCTKHLKELTKVRSNHPIYCVRKNEDDVGHELPPGSYKSPPVKKVIIESEDEEEVLTNLSHMENMPSPLQPFSSLAYRRSYTQPKNPPRNYPTVPSFSKDKDQTAAQKVVAASRASAAGVPSAPDASSSSAVQSTSDENECARTRPFTLENFNKTIKEESQDTQKKLTTRNPTPRVLPSSQRSFGGQMPLADPRRSPYTQPRHMPQMYPGAFSIQPTKYPLPSLPKTIPLERTQEPTKETAEMELVEDRRTPPPSFSGLGDVPRKVPYVTKPGQVRHKGPNIQPMPIPLPGMQQPGQRPQQFPIKNAMPLPPHRVKPSEMTLPSTPRPSFTATPKPYHYPKSHVNPNFGPNKLGHPTTDMNVAPRMGPPPPPRPEQPHMIPNSYLTSPIRSRAYTVKSTTGKYATMDMSRIANDSNYKNITVKNFLKMGGIQSADVEQRIQMLSQQTGMNNPPQSEPKQLISLEMIRQQQQQRQQHLQNLQQQQQQQQRQQPVEIPLERVPQVSSGARPGANRQVSSWVRATPLVDVHTVPNIDTIPLPTPPPAAPPIVVSSQNQLPEPVQPPVEVAPQMPEPVQLPPQTEEPAPSTTESAVDQVSAPIQPPPENTQTTSAPVSSTEQVIPVQKVEEPKFEVAGAEGEKPILENASTAVSSSVVEEEKSAKEDASSSLIEKATPVKAPIPQPLPKSGQRPSQKTEETSRKRKNEEPSSTAPTPKRKPVSVEKKSASSSSTAAPSSGRTPRAAAILANQAITSKTPVKEDLSSKIVTMDPLSMLAAVSEIELQKERKEKSASVEVSPTGSKGSSSSSRPSSSKKSNSTPNVRRRSSRGKGKESDEKEE